MLTFYVCLSPFCAPLICKITNAQYSNLCIGKGTQKITKYLNVEFISSEKKERDTITYNKFA